MKSIDRLRKDNDRHIKAQKRQAHTVRHTNRQTETGRYSTDL